MTFCKFARAATAVATVALLWSTIESRELNSPDSDSYLGRDVAVHAAVALDQVLGESWPKGFGVQMTGMINASFTCYGQFGIGFYE